jgi:hypothetical protein
MLLGSARHCAWRKHNPAASRLVMKALEGNQFCITSAKRS